MILSDTQAVIVPAQWNEGPDGRLTGYVRMCGPPRPHVPPTGLTAQVAYLLAPVRGRPPTRPPAFQLLLFLSFQLSAAVPAPPPRVHTTRGTDDGDCVAGGAVDRAAPTVVPGTARFCSSCSFVTVHSKTETSAVPGRPPQREESRSSGATGRQQLRSLRVREAQQLLGSVVVNSA